MCMCKSLIEMYSFRYQILNIFICKMFIFKLIVLYVSFFNMHDTHLYTYAYDFLWYLKIVLYFNLQQTVSFFCFTIYSKLLFFSIQHTSFNWNCFSSNHSMFLLLLGWLGVKELFLTYNSILSNFSLSYSSPQQLVKCDIKFYLYWCAFLWWCPWIH